MENNKGWILYKILHCEASFKKNTLARIEQGNLKNPYELPCNAKSKEILLV